MFLIWQSFKNTNNYDTYDFSANVELDWSRFHQYFEKKLPDAKENILIERYLMVFTNNFLPEYIDCLFNINVFQTQYMPFELREQYYSKRLNFSLVNCIKVVPLGLNKLDTIDLYNTNQGKVDSIILPLKKKLTKNSIDNDFDKYLNICLNKLYIFDNEHVVEINTSEIPERIFNKYPEFKYFSFETRVFILMYSYSFFFPSYVQFNSFKRNKPFKRVGKNYNGYENRFYIHTHDLLFLYFCTFHKFINLDFDQNIYPTIEEQMNILNINLESYYDLNDNDLNDNYLNDDEEFRS